MFTLILPCCGQSTRYGLDKPKYLLKMPNNLLMIQDAISGLDLTEVDRFVFVTLKEHKANPLIFPQAIHLELEYRTTSQVETVCTAIEKLNIKGSIAVKDCDNTFICKLLPGNFVCTSRLDGKIRADNKSYVNGDIIKEKIVISDTFCCGGYGWENAEHLLEQRNKSYLSECIVNPFRTDIVSGYKDYGTINEYKQCFEKMEN